LTKTVEKHSKYRKITEFQSKIGPQKFPSGPHAAHGPRVGHPCFKVSSRNGNFIYLFILFYFISHLPVEKRSSKQKSDIT
jgi:hypothetical protein